MAQPAPWICAPGQLEPTDEHPRIKPLRLRLAVAAALASLGALAAGGTPTLRFNPSGMGGFVAAVGASDTSSSDPMLVNANSSPAVISAIALSGANTSEFTLSGSAVAPCAVGTVIRRAGSAGNFCGLHFTLNPISPGSKLATATVTFSNATTASISPGGEAVLPGPMADVQALPNPLPDAAVGSTGAAFRAVYVSDRGAQSIGINGFTLSGPNAADFALAPVRYPRQSRGYLTLVFNASEPDR